MNYCETCGAGGGVEHACATVMPELEPPRFCADCGRRMVVQVTPRGWNARCVEHGVRTG